MGPVAKEIKKCFDEWKKYSEFKELTLSTPRYDICDYTPFTNYNFWFYSYLFPELLLIYDEHVEEKHKKLKSKRKEDVYPYSDDLEKFKKSQYIYKSFSAYNSSSSSGPARIFPCWVLDETEVLRIMSEIIEI